MEIYTFSKSSSIREPEKAIDHVRIVMIGKTGSGKSATANTILGRRAFKEGDSSMSETMSSCVATTKLSSGRRVTVIDTPGLKDTSRSDETILLEIARIAYLFREGVHAFAFVRNVGDCRFSGSEEDVYNTIKKGFGDKFKDHCFLVCSRADAALKDSNMDGFIEAQRKHEDVRSFLDEMNLKIVAVDNKTDIPAERKRNQDAIIGMVDHILQETTNEPYTNDLFQKALELHRKVEAKAKEMGWHPALVDAVIEVFDTYTSLELTDEVLYQTVLNLLEKSKTGSVDKGSGKVKLVHNNRSKIVDSSQCEEQVKLIFQELRQSVSYLLQTELLKTFLAVVLPIAMPSLGVTSTIQWLRHRYWKKGKKSYGDVFFSEFKNPFNVSKCEPDGSDVPEKSCSE